MINKLKKSISGLDKKIDITKISTLVGTKCFDSVCSFEAKKGYIQSYNSLLKS